ncbi:MAG TPA: hypothetical protein VHB77_17315, partial [Planctomycetaceae bacterium]|nr:hypothetical protein [Planctomycetaceae bacterium]
MPRFLKHISVVRAASFAALALSLWSSSRLVAQEQPQPQDPIRQRIFVPWTDLETLIDRDRRGVLLPNAEFQKLFETARKHAGEIPQVNEGYAVTRVDYVGRLSDDQLLLTATIDFTVFTPGWKAIPLGWKGLSVERATVGDQSAQLGRTGDADRPLYLLENRPGKRTLTVELSRTLDSAGSDKFASFGLTSAPTGTFEITLPAEKHLQFDGLPIERTAAHDQPAKYRLPIGGRKTLSLRITDRPTQQTSEGLVFATSAMALRVEPEEVTWQDITRLQVYGKPLDQLSFTIPTELALVSVTSPGLEKWEFAASEDDPEKTILKLSYRQPFQEARTVNIAGVLPVKARKWTAPTLKLANATAHTAILVVSRPAGLRLRLDEAVGASRAGAEGGQVPQALAAQDGQPALEAPTLPGASGSDVKTTYHAWREDFTLSFTTEEKARELQAAISTLLNISAQGLDLHTSIGVQTRFAPLFEIGLTLPAEWNVVEIRKDGQTVAWQSVPEKPGVHELRIPFDPPLPVGQAATITLVAHRDLENWPVEEGSVSFALPEVQLLQADVVEGTYQVLAEKDLQVVANQVRGLDPANAVVPAGQEIPRLSYEYQDTHITGELSISRKPSRIAAISLAYVRLDRETLSSHLEALLTVEGGGIRRLDLSLPESAGNDLRFQLVDSPVQIVEQTAAAPANGRRVWTLQFDQRVTGALRVVVDVETKRGEAKEFSPPLLTIPAAERESSRIAVEAATDQELDITAVGANGEPLIDMDPADIPAPRLYFPRERIVAAYTGTAPGAKITLSETRFERDAVPTAICENLQIESVLGETGEFQHRAIYTFRAVGVQNLLATLPETGLLWAAVVNGQPVEVRKAEAGYLIPLPHVDDVAAPRTLQLFYRTEVGRMSAAGRLQQSPPRVSAVNGEGQEQPMDVLQQHWTVHHPGETEFIASRAQFQPDHPLVEAGFLGSLQRSFGVDSPVNLGWKLLGLAIVFAVLGFVWMGYRRFGYLGLASAVGVIIFGSGAVTIFAFISMASSENMSSEFYYGAANKSAPGVAYTPAPTGAALRTEEPAPMAEERMHGMDADMVMDEADVAKSERDGRVPAKNAYEEAEAAARTAVELRPRAAEPPVNQPAAPVDDAFAMAGDPNAPRDQVPPPPQAVAPPQQPVAGPGPGVMPPLPKPAAPARAGGLMSLSLNLEPPPGGRTTQLTYTGVAGDEAPQMDLRYENRRQLSYITLFVEMLVVIVFWWFRRASLSKRMGLAACGLCLPIGLASTAPLATLPYLDGILFGTVAGLVLWLVAGLAHGWRTYRVRRPMWAAPSATLLVALALGLSANTARAQDPVAAPAAQQAPPQVAPRVDVPFGGRQAVIVPYEEGTDPLKAEKIYLPYERFVELWNQAHPDRLLQTSAPVDGLVDEALYAIEVVPFKEGQPARANVTARIVLTSFRKDQIQLALPLGRVAFQSAQLDGKSAALITPPEADKPLEVAVTGVGPHVLDLKFAVAVERIGPAGRLALPLKPVPSGLLRFVLPAPDLTVRVNGGGAFRRTKLGDDQLVLIPVDQGGDVTIAWQPAQTRAAVEGTIHTEIAQGLIIDDSGVRLEATSVFRVRQGSLSEALFALPAPLAVRRIGGP